MRDDGFQTGKDYGVLSPTHAKQLIAEAAAKEDAELEELRQMVKRFTSIGKGEESWWEKHRRGK